MNAFLDYLKQATQARVIDGPLRVLGIDLGTTNSTAAELVWSPDQAGPPDPRCLAIDQPTEDGRYTHVLLPSMVAPLEGRVLIGEGAKRLRARSSELGLERGRDLFWDCKNDMGLQRTYHRAPKGFRSAKEIGGQVLRFVMDAIETEDSMPSDRVVVTVPASFQSAQRRDTIEAARLARLELVGGDLVDEPVAAFLDYGFTHGLEGLGQPGQGRNLLVFDFGGGTCDVAVFRIRLPGPGDPLEITPLAVSRYHRLGGGDIDASVVYEVLLEQILEQNQLGPHDLTFEDKKQAVEPAFLGVAESLKISLCKEISRLHKFGKYQDADKAAIAVKNPGAHHCQLKDNRNLSLQSPTLSAARFLELLTPFLDPDVVVTRETEYRLTCSIFGPLGDALDRSRLSREDVDLCLLVGGSSLILPVQQAVAGYFQKAHLLTFEDADAVQTAVARGGAYHALLLAATGKGVLQPIAGDAISIRTDSGTINLIPAHVPLPYPGEGKRWAETRRLAVPRSGKKGSVEMRNELVDSYGTRLCSSVWKIPGPVAKGDPLVLRYRLNENQTLEMELNLAVGHGAPLTWTVENPLTNVRNPSHARAQIDTLEEDLKNNRIARADWPNKLGELADLHEDLGQFERAFDLWKKTLRALGTPTAYVLNRMAMVCDNLRDYERVERFYREAAALGNDGIPLFNLALFYQRRGRLTEAAACVDAAIERERKPPYLVLQARLADSLKDGSKRDASLAEATRLFGDIDSMADKWEVWWFKDAAQMRGDAKELQRATRRLADLGAPQQYDSEAPLPIDRGTPT